MYDPRVAAATAATKNSLNKKQILNLHYRTDI